MNFEFGVNKQLNCDFDRGTTFPQYEVSLPIFNMFYEGPMGRLGIGVEGDVEMCNSHSLPSSLAYVRARGDLD
jgi:hypothetical protein